MKKCGGREVAIVQPDEEGTGLAGSRRIMLVMLLLDFGLLYWVEISQRVARPESAPDSHSKAAKRYAADTEQARGVRN